jgi:hypothetical protein
MNKEINKIGIKNCLNLHLMKTVFKYRSQTRKKLVMVILATIPIIIIR